MNITQKQNKNQFNCIRSNSILRPQFPTIFGYQESWNNNFIMTMRSKNQIQALARSGVERDVLTSKVRERVHFWARPTMEKGSQWVGMKECRIETVAIPPIVERSSALKVSITIYKPTIFAEESETIKAEIICLLRSTNGTAQLRPLSITVKLDRINIIWFLTFLRREHFLIIFWVKVGIQ